MIRLSDRERIETLPVLSSHLPFATWYRSTGIVGMRTRSRSAENRRHHAIRQGRSEGRFTTPPADPTIALVEGRLWGRTGRTLLSRAHGPIRRRMGRRRLHVSLSTDRRGS